MAFFGLIEKRKVPQDDMLISQAVDVAALSEEKMRRDLEELDAFKRKIQEKKVILDLSLASLKPEEAALKMKNPFRGK